MMLYRDSRRGARSQVARHSTCQRILAYYSRSDGRINGRRLAEPEVGRRPHRVRLRWKPLTPTRPSGLPAGVSVAPARLGSDCENQDKLLSLQRFFPGQPEKAPDFQIQSFPVNCHDIPPVPTQSIRGSLCCPAIVRILLTAGSSRSLTRPAFSLPLGSSNRRLPYQIAQSCHRLSGMDVYFRPVERHERAWLMPCANHKIVTESNRSRLLKPKGGNNGESALCTI